MEEKVKKPKAQIIIILSIIFVIFTYIACDILFFKSKVNHKVEVVYEKFDSLELYLDEKLPQIDSALTAQQKQFEELKQLTNSYKK